MKFHASENNSVTSVNQEKPRYFWDRLSVAASRKGTVLFFVLLCVLPIIISLTVRPWIYMLRGDTGIKFLYYEGVNQYWYSTVYILSTFAMVWMLINSSKIFGSIRFSCLKDKTWLESHWLPLGMLFLLIWSILSTCFVAKDKITAISGDFFCHEGLLMFFFYATFFVIASTLTLRQMNLITEVLVAVCAFTGILAITQGHFFPQLFYLEDRRTLMFHNNNHYGYFLAICVPLAIGLALNQRNDRHILNMLRIAELWLIFNAAAVNSVRGSTLGMLGALIGWHFYIFGNKKEKKKDLLQIDMLFFGTFLFLNTGSVLTERFMYLFNQIFHLVTDSEKMEVIDELGSGRGKLWKYGIQFICEKPIFGYGPANLMEPYAKTECTLSSPHNDLILIGASMGVPAVIFYVGALAGHLHSYLKFMNKMGVFEVTLLAGVGSYLISSLVGTSIYYTTPYFYMLLGFSYRACKQYYDVRNDHLSET